MAAASIPWDCLAPVLRTQNADICPLCVVLHGHAQLHTLHCLNSSCTAVERQYVRKKTPCNVMFIQALEQRGVSPDGNDLIRHNMMVFQDGEGALQVRPFLLSLQSCL